MLTDFQALDARETLRRAVELLMAGSQQDFPVLEGETPVGILTRDDLIRALQAGGAEQRVGDVIRRDLEPAEAGEPLEEVVARMREHRRSALPVVSRGELVGLVTLENVGDLLLVRGALRRHGSAR
jgi:CBS domain-containing protein